ncbi:MAG: helix-turn-helix domain-containing protein [Lachnospiraceae bacterium]|nr:helix-turn-helix domain-containing protein [Lachnospiraceae bacterium]
MTLGERLIALRKENGYLTRKTLAEELGMPDTTLRNYETDVREPGHSFLIRVSEKFNVSIDWLLGVSEDKERTNSYQLKSSEYALIEKYRSLDQPGREHVDAIIQWESDRAEQIASLDSQIADLDVQKRIDAEVEDYRRQLELEESQTDGSSVSLDTAAKRA